LKRHVSPRTPTGARIRRAIPALALAATVLACTPGEDPPPPQVVCGITDERGQVARCATGAVAVAHPLAAEAGARMLAEGGNAVDAAVAAAFVLAVVEPSMSGLGGRAQILIRTPDGEHHGIDATTQAPVSYDPDSAPQASYGYPTVGVPGVPAGLLRALDEFGTLPRATVMAPAITYAAEGFELLPGEAERQAGSAERLREFEGSRRYFLRPDGSPREPGEHWVQEDLAATLRTLAEEGADAFYRGSLARAMAADLQANGAAVTLESLAEYRAESSRIVRDDYRGLSLVGLWIPSFGAITIQALNLLETLPMAELDEAEWAAALAEAIHVAYLDRPRQRDTADAGRMTSDEYAAERAALMRLPEGVDRLGLNDAGEPRAEQDRMVALHEADLPPAWLEEVGHTTHLTTADAQGMVVSLTQSNGPTMGSRVAAPGLGFLYAATLGGYLGRMEPGERARSHISPFMVERDGRPFLALGAAGGGRIPTAIVAVVSRVVDREMSLADALRAPRIVPTFGSQADEGDPDAPREVEVEAGTGMGFDAALVQRLQAMGYTVEVTEREGAFGRVHAVRWHDDPGVWEAAADPDWEGAAAVPGGVR
jgi:gamma-glutamyltranspeptidase / glutathione hydrolase